MIGTNIKLDKFAIRCAKCNTVFGSLAHLGLYNKRICNNCCPTSKFDSKGLFIECECSQEESFILKHVVEA